MMLQHVLMMKQKILHLLVQHFYLNQQMYMSLPSLLQQPILVNQTFVYMYMVGAWLILFGFMLSTVCGDHYHFVYLSTAELSARPSDCVVKVEPASTSQKCTGTPSSDSTRNPKSGKVSFIVAVCNFIPH